jgi:CBS domain-containing protein
MQVFEVMTPEVIRIGPQTTLVEAARTMKTTDVGLLPVCVHDQVIGMLTDRDITLRSVAEGRDPRTTEVQEVMTPRVVFCSPEDDIRAAAALMQFVQLRRLLVMNELGRLVGIVSLSDIALTSGDEKLAGRTLERVSEPPYLRDLSAP